MVINNTAAALKVTRSLRNKVASTSDNGPSLGIWLDRVRAIGEPALTEAVEGIWCGREGRATMDLPGVKSMLVVGWYNGRVEFTYLS
jgi:hypothetical protein